MSPSRIVNGRYELLERLGAGSSGETYRVRDSSQPSVDLALKLLTSDEDLAADLFRSEFRLLTGLRHPNLRRVFDLGVDQATGRPFYTAEYVPGQDLLAAAQGAPIGTVIQWAVQVCRALHYLHSRGIIHNDIKTQNVLISSAPDLSARLIDFGFWSLQDPSTEGVARGTAQYLAPERIRFGRAEPSSDFYALGVLLYRVFTGRFPFEAPDLPGLYRLHLDASPAPPHRIRPDLGESLSRLILRLLEKDPARRYPDAAGVIRALGEVAGRRFTLQTAATVPSHVVGWELVGRDREMRRLRELLIRTARGSAPDPWHVVLQGEMGLGKSRLLSEVRQEAELRRILWLQGHCYRQSADPLLPVRNLARSAASHLGTRRTAARDPLTAFVDQLLETARRRPVILSVEDLHAAEPALLRWLESLGRRIDSLRRSGRGAPALMMVTTRRPESTAAGAATSLMRLPGTEELLLEPVPAHAWRSYLVDAFGGGAELEGLAEEVARRSGGVPFFFTELLRLLLEQDVLRFDGQDWILPRQWRESLRVPSRSAQLIKARLRELNRTGVLELLALQPGPVSWEFLKSLHEGTDESLAEQLAELRQRQLVLAHLDRGGRSYEIAHPAYREVIEGELDEGLRRRLHRAIAERLTETVGDDPGRRRDIAHHWFEAGEPERAIPHARAVLDQTGEQGDDNQAIALAHRILACSTTDRQTVFARLIERLARQGDLVPAIQMARRAMSEARRDGDAANLVGALRSLATLYGRLGRVTAAERYARAAVESAATLTDIDRARARTTLAQILAQRGATGDALVLVDEALHALTRAGERDEQARARMLRAELLEPDHEAASQELLTAMQCFRESDDRLGGIEAEVRLGQLLRAHDPSRCLRHAASARRRAKRVGHRGLLGQAESLLSWLCMGRERYRQAFRHARTSYEIAREIGTVRERIESTIQLAGSHYCVGSGDVALRYLREVMGLRHMFAAPALLGRVRLAAGRAMLSMGRPGRAVRSLRSLLRHSSARRDRLLSVEGRLFLAMALFEGSPGASQEAEGLVRAALADLHGLPAPETEALALQTLGRIQASLGQRHLARDPFERAVKLLRGRQVYAYDGLEVALTDLAEFLLEDDPPRAHALLQEVTRSLERKVRCGMRRGPLDRAQALAGRCELVLGDRRRGHDGFRQAGRLLEVNRLLNSEVKLQPLLERILEVAIEVLEAERGLVLLGGADVPRVARGIGEEDDRFSATVVREVMTSGASLRIENALEDHRLAQQASVLELRLCSILAVPLRTRGEVAGVIYLEDRRRADAFGPDDLTTLEAIADQAGIALTNADLVETLLQRQGELESAQRRIENLNAALRDRVDEQSDTILRMSKDLERVRGEMRRRFGPAAIVGESKAILDVLETVTRLAPSSVPVYLYAESGCGKDMIARALHFAGPRAERSFVSMNCAAVPDTLMETELFGHVRGAFTGATEDRVGLLEEADGGTLFLDEVAEMSLAMQAKLLRVLEDGQVRRVGATDAVHVNVRLVSATNRDLAHLVASGQFREDLFYRLNVFRLELPPLRDRREDIPALIDCFVERHLEDGREPPTWSPAARRALLDHHWPGNVRELENEVRRALLLCEGVVVPEHLSPHVVSGRPAASSTTSAPGNGGGPTTLAEATHGLERTMILEALERNRQNRTRAARQLGIPKSSLYNKLKRYGLDGGADD